ncbi:MAG: hypothetical protein ACYC36_16470 [Bellilinea sp.]
MVFLRPLAEPVEAALAALYPLADLSKPRWLPFTRWLSLSKPRRLTRRPFALLTHRVPHPKGAL